MVSKKISILDEGNLRMKVFASNFVDEDVKSMLQPINLMQSLVLNPKYFIKNNFIHPNDGVNMFVILSTAAVFSFSYLYRLLDLLLDENMLRYRGIDFLAYAYCINTCFYCMGFLINAFVNTMQTKQNVMFALTLQEVHRFLNDEPRLKTIIIKSWMYVSVMMVYHYIINTIYLVSMKIPFQVIFNYTTSASIDANVIYSIVLMKLLTEKLQLWNIQMLKKDDSNEMHCKKMFKAYIQILKCYEIYKKCFQLPFLFHVVLGIFESITDSQTLIEILKHRQRAVENNDIPPVSGSVYLFVIKILLLQVSISWHVDAFYVAVKNAQDSCTHILKSSPTDEEYKFCKNIMRVTRTSFHKMNVFGLFYMDINLPICLMTLITNNIIVLLQFAFL